MLFCVFCCKTCHHWKINRLILIQKYQYRNKLVFSSKHILLHSSKHWFWRCIRSQSSIRATCDLWRQKFHIWIIEIPLFLSPFIREQRKYGEGNNSESAWLQFSKNFENLVQNHRGRSLQYDGVLKFPRPPYLLNYAFFFFQFLWKSLRTVQPCNILDHECQLLIAGFCKIEVLESPLNFVALEYSAKECWTTTKEDKLPAAKGFSFKDITIPY